MHPMLKRAAATQACMDRFAFKPVEPGVRDCRDLGAHNLHHMGRSAKLLNGWKGKTWASALRYIRKQGCTDLPALIDKMGLERIPPAAALPGDLIGLPTESEGFGCSLAVALDNGRALALNPATGLIEPVTPKAFVAAWRV
ncbi:DUF6950 family protein [Brevundimonas sp. Root1279]|uniref:DUF6950 family protein n=1 Tax=Brevundimonas sp. Root1279 TaxID=1736443 RepID=UPI0007162589|nr:hypothetical protein [Brevundimonas sp. Root1279]KQW79709.1 hypothetical protein ASC65_14265 [Brevundimonas sp. Root1279]